MNEIIYATLEKKNEIFQNYPTILSYPSYFNEISQKYQPIDLEQIELIEIIEESPIGPIFKASYQKDKNFLAIKFLQITRKNNEKWDNNPNLLQILSEIHLIDELSKSKNSCILRLFSINEVNISLQKKSIILGFEYGLASMKEILKIRKEFNENEIISIVFPVIEALFKAETIKISHRNLNTSSLILNLSENNEFSFKIFDFSYGWINKSKDLLRSDTLFRVCKAYTAPEVLQLWEKSEFYDAFKADVYSLGVIMMEMMGISLEEIYNINEKNRIFNEKIQKYRRISPIIEEMIMEDVKKRVNFAEILKRFQGFERKKYEETIEILTKPLTNIEKLDNYAKIIEFLHKNLMKSDLCLKYCEKALTVISNLKPSEDLSIEKEAKLLTLYGVFLLETGDIDKSLQFHYKALKKLDKSMEITDKSLIILIERNIGLNYYEQEDYKASLIHLEKALDLQRNSKGQSAEIYVEIASNLRELKDYNRALGMLNKAIEINKNLHGDNSKYNAFILNSIGFIYKLQRDYKKSIEMYKRALKIYSSIEENSVETAETTNFISIAYKMLGTLKSSLNFQEKALKIKGVLYGEKSQEYANSLNNIANIYKEMKDYQKAIENHEKALNIKRDLFGENDVKTAVSMNNLGNIYLILHDFNKALDLHEKAYKIRKDVLGESHSDVALSLNNIAEVYQTHYLYKKALEIHLKALKIRKEIVKDSSSFDVGLSLFNVGVAYQGMEDYGNAVGYFEKALEEFKGVGEKGEVKRCCQKLRELYGNLGDKKNFEKYEVSGKDGEQI